MRRKRALEIESKYNAANVSSGDEVNIQPPPKQLNKMFDLPQFNITPDSNNAIIKNVYYENMALDGISQECSADDQFLLSDAEITEELLREHLQFDQIAK